MTNLYLSEAQGKIISTMRARGRKLPSRLTRQKFANDKVEALAESIRKKYLALKLGKAEVDEQVQKFFKPVVEPLNQLVKNQPNVESYATRFPGRKRQRLPMPIKSSTPEAKPSLANMSTIIEPQIKKRSEETFVHNPEEEEEKEIPKAETTLPNIAKDVTRESLGEYLSQYPELAHQYIDIYITDPELIDGTYGIVNDPELDRWTLGSKEVTFNQDNSFTIDGKRYPGTNGLYELLFMKEAKDKIITKQDRIFYKDILERTCVHRRGFTPYGAIKGSTSHKYRNFVKPLVNPAKSRSVSSPSGKGLSFYNNGYKIVNKRPVEYLYWNSLNELVDRLRLIYAEINAGNRAHWNEAASIIEELLETGKIYKLRGNNGQVRVFL